MKEKMKKISAVMKSIFGYGMLISLAVSLFIFLGFVVALIIGGDVAVKICDFLYKGVVPVLIYATSILVLFGLLAMYFGGEAALSGAKGKKKTDAKPDVKPDASVPCGEQSENSSAFESNGTSDNASEEEKK